MRHCLKMLAAALAMLALPAQAALAQVSPMVFKRLTQQDGLSQNTVNKVLQDHEGFIWLATQNGLNRFDGVNITRYLRDPGTPGALDSDYIDDLLEDRVHDLWLATDGAGVVRWRRSSNRFESIALPSPKSLQAARRRAKTLNIDARGQIWVGTQGGGIVVLDSLGRFNAEYTHDPENPGSLSSNSISDILSWHDGSVWVATDHGLDLLKPGATDFIHYRNNPSDPGSLADNDVAALVEDHLGALWVGTFKAGLQRLAAGAQRFERFEHVEGDESSLSNNSVRAIYADSANRLWVATANGLNAMNTASKRFTRILNDPADPYSLSDNYTASVFEDRSGLLWVGTVSGGVNRWNPRTWTLGLVAPPLLNSSNVTAFATTNRGETLWIGTIGKGLLKSDKLGGSLALAAPSRIAPLLSDPSVTALLGHSSGDLWVGTMAGGLNRYNPKEGSLKVFRADTKRPDALGADGIMSLMEARDYSVWAGTFGGGVARISANGVSVRRYFDDDRGASRFTSPRATALAERRDGKIWVGTDGGGLNLLDPVSGEVTLFGQDPKSPNALGAETVYALYHDVEDTLWIGTAGGGLARLEHSSQATAPGTFKRLSQNEGLSSSVIYGIQPGADGMLWLSSNNGLMRLNPKNLAIKVFHRANGLQGEEFNSGAHYAAPDGRIYFGGANGFNGFDARTVQVNKQPPQMALTGFEKFNRPVPLTAASSQTSSIKLAHDDDVVTFEFAALDYGAPESNQYSHKLLGFDRDWSTPSALRRATYTDLSAGEYSLLVKASNSDGVWSTKPLAVTVVVARPPWLRWWAFAAYVSLMALIVRIFLRWRFKKMESHARYLQLAYYDRLTGLPNLDLFQQRASQALLKAKEQGDTLAILSVQFGRFRHASRMLNSEDNNDALRAFAARLSQMVHGGGKTVAQQDIARLANESFVLYFCGAHAADDAESFVRTMLKESSEPFGSSRVSIAPAVGMALYPAQGDSITELIRFADTAASTGVNEHRKGLVHYDRAMTTRAADRLAMEHDLRHALARGELELFFQPKLNRNQRVIGSEALIRWTHPKLGPISPAVFVPLAEESDLIEALDDFVAESACRALRLWIDARLNVLPVAINVSAEDLSTGRIVGVIQRALSRHNIPPQLLEIEITESALLRDLDEVAISLEQLSQAGHKLILDDFGTGYSSLTHLQKFPISSIKIDRSFVLAGVSSEGRSVCQGIIGLAKSLRLKTVAEGVETPAQMEYVLNSGCDEIQGWLFYKALPQAEFQKLL